MEPNRIEQAWSYVERKLTAQYPQVPVSLWAGARHTYDGIVRVVRDTYAPGRAEIMIEAEVRDSLNRWVAEAEGFTQGGAQ